MRILIHASAPSGAIDAYNIRRLVNERPQHTYSILAVDRPRPPITAWLRMKRRLVELRDGADHWMRANEALGSAIRRDTPAVDLGNVPITLVDAVNDAASQRHIRAFDPDVIVQAGAGILKPEVFTLARIAAINVHHGIAPEVRGMRSTFWCLYYGLHDLIGATCHRIDATLDTGEVILQERHILRPGDTYVSIQRAVCRTGGDILVRSIDALEHGPAAPPLSTEVDSYYFSELRTDQFNALHRNGYRAVGDPATFPSKRRTKLRMMIR